MYRVKALPFALALSCALGTGPSAAAAPPGSAEQWKLVFVDEFDGAALDTAKWNYYYPWGRTHNHLAYARSGNVSVRDGTLILTALEEDFGGMPYTTGVVNTDGTFHLSYGYIEARLKMPSSKGSWPAFWTLQSGWPPEIDIMEFPLSDLSANHNEKYRYWWNYHWGTVSDHRSTGAEEWLSSDLSAGFHDYAVAWFADAMTFYFDGEIRGVVTDRSAIAQSAGMYMILNFAVGGWPGDPPSWPAAGDTFEIDWVRVWQPAVPDEYIDLGSVVAGGDGTPTVAPPSIGLNPATGALSDDLGLDRVVPSGANPRSVGSTYVDSVFILVGDTHAINTKGTRFGFPAGDAAGSTWDLIANVVEADGPPGVLRLGSQGAFTRGIGIHASAGVTFDLDALRERHGDRRVAFFSAFAGEGSMQAGGMVNNHVILADADGIVINTDSTGPHQDGGAFIEVEIPRNARFLTLATGAAGDGNGQDHGVFCNAFITPCSVSDPTLCDSPADEMLVFSGSTWKYLDEGPAPPSTWTGPNFITTGWKSGRAQLGYGDGDEVTAIGFGGDPDNKRITTHFRRTFSVKRPNEVTKLSLWLLRDDGAIVYLNGAEILRSNLPAGPVRPDTLATQTIDGVAEKTWVVAAVDPCRLVDGVNVVAVEVHQSTKGSSDLSFDLVLAADRDPEAPHGCDPDFARGNANADGALDIADAVFTLSHLFADGPAPSCLDAADANDDGRIDIADAITILAHLFANTGPLPAPFGTCGVDGTADDLGCARYGQCK